MPAIPPASRDDRSFPGEPGIGPDLPPPFRAVDPGVRWLFELNRKGIRPGLQRVRGLLDDLGRPEASFPCLVVAGTNGKGSTTRLLDRLLRDAGYRTACYTSPHLLSVYERLEIDGRPVDPDLFGRLVEEIRPSVDRHEASWFETLTAVALAAARESGVDVFCCETGLGGRLDASNALPAVATLLTGVSLDHRQILGDTVEEIAAEKLGLLKPGAPLFAAVAGKLKAQTFAAAVAAGSPCHFLDELTREETDADGWRLITRRAVYAGLPEPPLPVMRRNQALALLALEELDARGVLRLPPDPRASLERVFLPGRSQRVRTRPDWIVDTAHNPEALEATLTAFLERPGRGGRCVLFGGMADKEFDEATGRLLARADRVDLAPVSLPRSRNRDQLRALTEDWALATATVHAGVAEAVAALDAALTPADSVLVCGSCFLVAEALYAMGFRSLDETRAAVAADGGAR